MMGTKIIEINATYQNAGLEILHVKKFQACPYILDFEMLHIILKTFSMKQIYTNNNVHSPLENPAFLITSYQSVHVHKYKYNNN